MTNVFEFTVETKCLAVYGAHLPDILRELADRLEELESKGLYVLRDISVSIDRDLDWNARVYYEVQE